jgi:peptidoglycan/LPS O-acetylase OafA/YrhL
MRFKGDINALRGVAVTLVALFHFGVPGLDGGFIGVDVFFVISGYLMTGIIVGRLEEGRFSLLDFYIARFVRIVPTLAMMCAALLAFGWFYLDPRGYKILAEHAGASIGFFSNFAYWREAGYFDTSSQTKWLLHTWSLSVEWQFYMLFPVVLVLASRWFRDRRKAFAALLWTMGGASFLLSLAVVRGYPEANFFLLPPRVWEMVAGGLVLLYADRFNFNQRAAVWLQMLGVAAILLAACIFTEASDWPGPLTLLPVIGAACVILSDAQHSSFSRARPLQWLGRRSYSIYLWHWPVVVFIRYVDWPVHEAVTIAGGVTASLALGWLSYELVERHSGALRHAFGRAGLGALVGGVFTVLFACAAVTLGNGYGSRLPQQVRQISAASLDVDPRRNECLIDSVHRLDDPDREIGCRYGKSATIGAILWGDSHGNAVITGVAAAIEETHRSVMFFGTSGCPPLIGASRFGKHREEPCRRFAARVASEIAAYPADVPLVVVARFSAYVEGKGDSQDPTILIGFDGARPLTDIAHRRMRYGRFVTNDLCALAKMRKVYVLLPIPEMGRDVPDYLARSLILGRHPADVSIPEADYARRNRVARDAIDNAVRECGVTALDPTPYLCRDERCYGSQSLVPLYIDGDHLNRRGSARLVPLFRQLFVPATAPLPAREPNTTQTTGPATQTGVGHAVTATPVPAISPARTRIHASLFFKTGGASPDRMAAS